MHLLKISLKLLITGTETFLRFEPYQHVEKMQLTEAVSNIPVPSQLYGKIHVMLYLQTLFEDGNLDAQWDSNEQGRNKRKYLIIVNCHAHCTLGLIA